ncbi:nucleotide exchange factor GrpE [Frankia sp. Mgl5]|uniref:nucleotide exchange factor GrpE n=1 Tax=Frankia sp. Mgl5 TaxID=2933793 RepID=UPI00200C5BC3|nr:nucleotide exchange factor GrpE [Frankia sp. Mgl5]MCK9931770.1 nucleotide exchange factor GrpE [Frankia sp. Mgl5]
MVIAALGGAAVGLAVGAAGARWAGTRRRDGLEAAAEPRGPVEPPQPAGPVEPPGPVESSSASASTDREALVGACIELSDRLRDANPALWRRLCRGLAVVGVDAVVVDGQRFDPEVHDAVGREITTDAARHLTVASTEFCGFTDRGRLLRRPEVVVYRMEETV